MRGERDGHATSYDACLYLRVACDGLVCVLHGFSLLCPFQRGEDPLHVSVADVFVLLNVSWLFSALVPYTASFYSLPLSCAADYIPTHCCLCPVFLFSIALILSFMFVESCSGLSCLGVCLVLLCAFADA